MSFKNFLAESDDQEINKLLDVYNKDDDVAETIERDLDQYVIDNYNADSPPHIALNDDLEVKGNKVVGSADLDFEEDDEPRRIFITFSFPKPKLEDLKDKKKFIASLERLRLDVKEE